MREVNWAGMGILSAKGRSGKQSQVFFMDHLARMRLENFEGVECTDHLIKESVTCSLQICSRNYLSIDSLSLLDFINCLSSAKG